jgi:hypothetical protein
MQILRHKASIFGKGRMAAKRKPTDEEGTAEPVEKSKSAKKPRKNAATTRSKKGKKDAAESTAVPDNAARPENIVVETPAVLDNTVAESTAVSKVETVAVPDNIAAETTGPEDLTFV